MTTLSNVDVELTGAQVVLETMAANGLDVCFANPGTTEMPLVAAMDRTPAIRPVLGLFEGVCTGAADGYARISGRPASTLLHLGPGLANGIANLHNARRAHSPMLNLVGDQASWHLAYDAPLTSDIHSLARPVCGFVRTSQSPQGLGQDVVDAVGATNRHPRLPATLVLPLDFQSARVTGRPAGRGPAVPDRETVAGEVIDACAQHFSQGRRVTLILGGNALSAAGQRAAASLMQQFGANAFTETFPAVSERGGGIPHIDRLPYFPETAIEALAGADVVLLAGGLEPVSYFGYEGIPARLSPENSVRTLARPEQDAQGALIELCRTLGIPDGPSRPVAQTLPAWHPGPLDPAGVVAVLARRLPEESIVSVEGGTCGYPFSSASAGSAAHTVMTNTGGAIGQGLPAAVGAAVAAPGRRVVALESDGSAQYTVQSLWTMAREQLPVTVLLIRNGRYGVLQTELKRISAPVDGPAGSRLTNLSGPDLDWTEIARGYGVPAVSVSDTEALDDRLGRALVEDGPVLIEVNL